MSIYVDDILTYKTKLKYKKWCHLLTDGTISDLHAFASKLGLKRSWYQDKSLPHYDLTPNKRKLALKNGARSTDGEAIKRILNRFIRPEDLSQENS